MEHGVIADILAWIAAHPNAAISVVFAVAVAESIFLFGLLIPGAIFMFTFGALIGGDAMSMTATFAAAIIGTFIGDGGSYMLGRLYRGRLHALPGLSRIPGGVARGEAFFARHGGKGIILGRLIGALRPIMPTVAGAAGLSVTRFVIMDIIATAIWAPLYILPGVVLGASLDLAAQVVTRLAILLIGGAAIVWALMATARFLIAAGQAIGRRYAEQLLAWSRHHRRLGLLGPALADPRQPEIPALAVAATLLMAVIAVLYLLLWGWDGNRYPTRFDAIAFYLLQSLHTPLADGFARMVAELGAPLIYLPFAGVIFIVLSAMGNWRAAGHWLVAVLFSALATVLLGWLLAIPAPLAFFHGHAFAPVLATGGGQDLVLCATIYGLFGRIVAARSSEAIRSYYYSATVAGVSLIALCRLYLGLDWASDTVIGLAGAFVWINMLVLGYRRQRPRPVRGQPVLTVLGGFVIVAGLLAVLPDSALRRLPVIDTPATGAPVANWSHQGYENLADHQLDLRGQQGALLNVQAAGERESLVETLGESGWVAPPRLGPGQALRSLAPDTAIDELAVMPRVHDGRRAGITLVHSAPDGRSPARWVLRLWPTGRTTQNDHVPLWVGMVDAQVVNHELHMLATANDDASYRNASSFLMSTLRKAGIGYQLIDRDDKQLVLLWSRTASANATVAPD
ncbi:MAG: VTT domain-containing protein [Salinisphaera sp.]|jgi:membrane protein DedA with SNARE-associated domain|nr:VTT domain-containing protein [Salinisphaera sp.]